MLQFIMNLVIHACILDTSLYLTLRSKSALLQQTKGGYIARLMM